MLNKSISASRQSVRCCADKSAFIFGLGGYTSLALGNTLQRRGWQVAGSYRNQSAARQLKERKPSWELVHFDPGNPIRPGHVPEEVLEALSRCSHVLSSIPPIALPLYDPVLTAQLKALRLGGSQLNWVGYLSSTGVYGDYGGAWVDERSECRSSSSRGFVRREHEVAWAAAAAKQPRLPLHIFRLGGIYGPGRSVLESLKRRDASGAPPEGSSSQQRRGQQKNTARCHVEDICSAIAASMEGGIKGRGQGSSITTDAADADQSSSPMSLADITCLVDDDPAPRAEVVAYTQALLAASEQPASTSTSSASTNSAEGRILRQPPQRQDRASKAEGLEEKRVSNVKMKHALLPELHYPSYREGMKALVDGNISPFEWEDLQLLGLATETAPLR